MTRPAELAEDRHHPGRAVLASCTSLPGTPGECGYCHTGRCRQLTTSRAAMAAEAAAHPASFVAFDLLALDFADQRQRPWVRRRADLEELAAAWRPPLHVSPATFDVEQARVWLRDYRVAGLEGLVVKPLRSPYVPGRRAW